MPTINLAKKRRDITVNKLSYQKVYQDKRWRKLRAAKFAENPVCEICEREGRVHQTEEIHHIVPFDISDSRERIEELAFDWNNLISLCTDCHHKEHLKLRK